MSHYISVLLCWLRYKKVKSIKKNWGPWATLLTWETVPINIHICAKLCFYHNTDYEKKITISFNLENWNDTLFEQTRIPFTRWCPVHIFFFLKLAKWFWRRFLNFVNLFSLFCYILSLLCKGPVPSLESLKDNRRSEKLTWADELKSSS